jgi:hypothetical protein
MDDSRGCTLLGPIGPPFVQYQPACCRRDHEYYGAGPRLSNELGATVRPGSLRGR